MLDLFEKVHPLLAFSLRPFLVITFFSAMTGYGYFVSKFLFKEKDVKFFDATGVGASVGLIGLTVMGLMNLFTVGPMLIAISVGLMMFLPQTKNLIQQIEFNKMFPIWLWPIYLILVVMFIRSSAPPYFVDTCLVHYAYAEKMAVDGCISPLKHAAFISAHTTLFPQILLVPAFLLGDEIVANLVSYVFSILILVQIYKIALKFSSQQIAFVPVLLVAGTGAFFDNTVYSKVACIYIFMILEATRQIVSREPKPFYLGLCLGLCFILKFTFALLVPALIGLFIIFHSWKKFFKCELLIKIILGSLAIIILWMLVNLKTQGLLLFPFVVNEIVAPMAMLDGASNLILATSLPWLEKFQLCLEVMFLGEHSRGFKAYYFPYFLLLTFLLLPKQNRGVWALVYLTALANWIFWVFVYKHHQSSFRQSFSGWILPLFGLCAALYETKREWVRRMISVLAFVTCLMLIQKHWSFLPGLRLHLGQQTKVQFYNSLDLPVLSRFSEDKLSNLEMDGKIAVLSEYYFVLKHPNKDMLYWSPVFDPDRIKSPEDLRKILKESEFEYFLVDLDLHPIRDQKTIGLTTVLKKALSDDDLEMVEDEKYYFLLRNKYYRNL